MNIPEEFAHWVDVDAAIVLLGRQLGILGEDVPKWVYAAANPVGTALYETLGLLVEAGILECDDSPAQPDIMYRWVFDGDLRALCFPPAAEEPGPA